jgi:hypothetical protein
MYGLYSQAQPNTGNLKMAKLDGILFQSDYNNKSYNPFFFLNNSLEM